MHKTLQRGSTIVSSRFATGSVKSVLLPNEYFNKSFEANHKEHSIDLPQVFVDLFVKHLVAGNPLEPSLPLTDGNIC